MCWEPAKPRSPSFHMLLPHLPSNDRSNPLSSERTMDEWMVGQTIGRAGRRAVGRKNVRAAAMRKVSRQNHPQREKCAAKLRRHAKSATPCSAAKRKLRCQAPPQRKLEKCATMPSRRAKSALPSSSAAQGRKVRRHASPPSEKYAAKLLRRANSKSAPPCLAAERKVRRHGPPPFEKCAAILRSQTKTALPSPSAAQTRKVRRHA